MQEKFQTSHILDQYRSGVENYRSATLEIGLWKSEQEIFEKYLQKDDSILDLGCGTGRTTFALHKAGYKDILGVDITPEMIATAEQLNNQENLNIRFVVGDATQLNIEPHQFDSVIFSFNGLFSIPQHSARQRAMKEVHRVLKNNGKFIFTSHDRDSLPEYFSFWKEEKSRWKAGAYDPRLHEYGDLFVQSRNETRPIFIHIPDQKEVNSILSATQFSVLDTFMRDERYQEDFKTKDFSSNCRFWVASKM